MSSYDAAARNAETQQQALKGEGAFLTPQERATVQRLLRFPEDFPKEFQEWLIDFMAANIPQIPVSHLVGFRQIEQTEVTTATVATSQSTTSGAYTDLATAGPSISGLRAGRYIVSHGCLLANTGGTSGWKALQSVSVNGAAAADADAVQQNIGVNGDTTASVSTVLVKDLAEVENTLACKYKIAIAGTCTAANRWLIAQRIGPIPTA